MSKKTGQIARLLSLLLLAALMLSACAPAATPTAAPAEPTQAPAEPTTAPEPTKAPEPTAEPTQAPAVEISYMYPGGIPKDTQSVMDAMNQILLEKANATIKLVPVDWGSYTDKVNLMVSSGEACDLLFVAPWMAPSYSQLVANGALAPLDELLKSDGNDLYQSVPEFAWKATAINGKIYGVPNQQIWVKPFGPSIRKDLAEKYKLDLAKLNKIEDLEPFLAAVKAGEADVIPASGGGFITEYFGWDPIVTQAVAVSVKYDDAEMKVFNAYDTPEFKAHIELMAKWYNAGYFPSEIIPGEEFNNQWKAGKLASNLFEVQKPGGDLEFKNNRGQDIVSKNLSPIFMTTGSVTATMNGICASSKNPNTAMKVLNLLNTDVKLYNILAKGVEGKHWVWVDQANNIIGPGPEKDNYNPGTDWMFGSVFNAYYADKSYADIKFNEATKALNDGSAPSVALGFTFNPDPVKNEIAQVSAVVKELGEPLMGGMVDPATAYPEYIQALKDAGIEKIVAEAQSQLNAWAGK